MGEIVTVDQRVAAVRAQIQKSTAEIEQMLPTFMAGQRDRFFQIAMQASTKKDLLGCEPVSIVAAIIKAAQCGLPLDGTHAALVPYMEKGVPLAQFIPMFQGLIVAALRNGNVKAVWSNVVYEGEEFTWVAGSEPKLVHKPNLIGKSIDKAVAVYACCVLPSGHTIFEVMDREQVHAIKKNSKAREKGPWSKPDQEGEMWRKTSVRRLSKYMPKSPDLQKVLDADEEFEPFEPREPEYEEVASTPRTNGGPKRELADIVPTERRETQSQQRQPAREVEEVLPVRWHADIEISLSKPFERWADQKLNSEGPLNGLTYREVASSSDPKVRAAVDEALKKGAQIQADKATTPTAFQKLAEARRSVLAAGPLANHAPVNHVDADESSDAENTL